MNTLLIAVSVCVALNIIIILAKYKYSRRADAVLDAALLILVGYVFSSSFNALVVGTFGSMLVSIYLLFNPKLTSSKA